VRIFYGLLNFRSYHRIGATYLYYLLISLWSSMAYFPLNPSLLSHPLDWDRTYRGAVDVAHRCIFIPHRSHPVCRAMEGGHNTTACFSAASPLISPPRDSFAEFPPHNVVLWADSLPFGRVQLVCGIDSSYLPFAIGFGRFCWGFSFDMIGPSF
jgi:hypothetical protein